MLVSGHAVRDGQVSPVTTPVVKRSDTESMTVNPPVAPPPIARVDTDDSKAIPSGAEPHIAGDTGRTLLVVDAPLSPVALAAATFSPTPNTPDDGKRSQPILGAPAPATIQAMEIKAAKQAAVDHIEGKSSGINLCDPNNAYDSKMLELCTYTTTKRHPSFCFVFKPRHAFPAEHPAERSSFHGQLQQFVMLRNKLNKPAAYFIAEKPGAEGTQHYIFGAIFGNDLFIMDPQGGAPSPALSAAVLRAQKELAIENVYISTTPLHPDTAVGHAMSGPLCAEFMQHCQRRSFSTVQACFAKLRYATSGGEIKSSSLSDEVSKTRLVDITASQLMPHFFMRLLKKGSTADYPTYSKALRFKQRDAFDKGQFDESAEHGIMSRLLQDPALSDKLETDMQFRQLQDGLKTLGRRILSGAHIETSSPDKSPGSSANVTPASGSFAVGQDDKLLSSSGSFSVLDLTRSFSTMGRLPKKTPSPPLIHSVTMAQNQWTVNFYHAVSSFITKSHSYSELVDLFLGPESYWISQQHKQACQETEEADQRLGDERAFYARLYKTVVQFETKVQNGHILDKYEAVVINPEQKKVAEYAKERAAGKTLNATQQRELKQCEANIADYKAVRAQHDKADYAYGESGVSYYHKIMQETFKEDNESKQVSKQLSFQEQINAFGNDRRVAYRPGRALILDPNQLKELRMQLENDVGDEAFQSVLVVAYGAKLEKALQRIVIERGSDLPLDMLRYYKRELPLEIHEHYLAQLYQVFFTPTVGSRVSLFEPFLAKPDLLRFKQALQTKQEQLSAQMAKADAAQVALDLRYSGDLAEATHRYRHTAKQLMSGSHRSRIKRHLPAFELAGSFSSSFAVTPLSDDELLCQQILNTGIHTLPLRRVKDLETGNSLLHLVAAAYPLAGDTVKGELRKIFESLLKRGCDVLATNKAGLTPFAYANSLLPPDSADKTLPDWELLKIAFRNHPTTTVAQKQIKAAALKYFDLRQSLFRRVFTHWYGSRLSTVTRREQMHMALDALVNAVKEMKDDPLNKMIIDIEKTGGKHGKLLDGLRAACATQVIVHPDAEAMESAERDEKRFMPMPPPLMAAGRRVGGAAAPPDPEAAIKARLAAEKAAAVAEREAKRADEAERAKAEAERAKEEAERAKAEADRRERELRAEIAALRAAHGIPNSIGAERVVHVAPTSSSLTQVTARLSLPAEDVAARSSLAAPSPLPPGTSSPLPRSPSAERAFAPPLPSTPGILPPTAVVFTPAPTARVEGTPVPMIGTDPASAPALV